ncbi:MAG: hypothetical protein JWR39_1504 [Devosia sp.]|jgi:hypothetical protein|nr:hypothetical protein [Devosia sp.]
MRPLQVLLGEGEAILAAIMGETLMEAGYDAILACTADAAVE